MEVDEHEIKLTQEDLWSEIRIVKQGVGSFVSVDINLLLSHLMKKYKMPDDETTRKNLKYQLKKYREAVDKRIPPTKSVVLSFVKKREEECIPSSYKRRKSFTLLTKKWQKARTDRLIKKIERLVEEENSVCADDEEKITTTQLLGYLIYRINCEKDKKTAYLGLKFFDGDMLKMKWRAFQKKMLCHLCMT